MSQNTFNAWSQGCVGLQRHKLEASRKLLKLLKAKPQKHVSPYFGYSRQRPADWSSICDSHQLAQQNSAILPLSLELKAFQRLPCFSITTSVDNNFSLSLCTNVGPMVCFLVVFSVDVLHEVVDFRNWSGYPLFPPRASGPLNLSDSSSVLLPQRTFTIDPFTRNITVSTQLYCRPFIAGVDSGICGSQFPRCLFSTFLPSSLLFFFLCSTDNFILSRTAVTNWFLSSIVFFLSRALIQSSSPAQSVAILSHTFPRLCHHHLCFHFV